MSLLSANRKNIKKAAGVIKNGGLVAFPTETVYGLGADALNSNAVAKIFEAKNRPFFDPIIVHISSPGEMDKLVLEYDERAEALINNFWPGPLTLVLPKAEIIPDIVTAGLQTLAIRMPDNEIALDLIRESQTPIAAPSANPFGYISPVSAEQVQDQLGDSVEHILEGGKCEVGIESTIIKLDQSPVVLRHGGIPVEQIEEIIGKVANVDREDNEPASPGRMPSHYSPRTPLKIIENPDEINEETGRAGLLSFKPPLKDLSFKIVESLTENGDLREAAANFFSCLYRLDREELDIIYAEAIPEFGLGRAIMERLNKAAHR